MNRDEIINYIEYALDESFKMYIQDNTHNDTFGPGQVKKWLDRDEEVKKYLEEHLT